MLDISIAVDHGIYGITIGNIIIKIQVNTTTNVT